MKIGILTHPQGANYGGILQCYALCTYLRMMGHEPIVIQRVANRSFVLWGWIRSILKALHFPRYYSLNKSNRTVNIRPFIQKYILRTEPIDSQKKMKKVCKKYGFETIVVGSDQVWRKDFAMKFGFNYFLDFVPQGIKRLSYAASFGLSDWQYSEQETSHIKKLLSTFSGISVRESEAIPLIEQNVRLYAVQHVDPTLLLTANDYSKLANKRLITENYIFVYWLGRRELITKRIQELTKSGKKVICVFLRDNKVQVTVEDWLSYIKYAEYIVTDSFHGCVYSIIFHKKFDIFSNDSGGNGRLTSLLSSLGITNSDKDIDYNSVDRRLIDYRESAISYLNTNLQ